MLMTPRHWVVVRTLLVSPLSGTTVCVLATWTSFAGSSSRLFAIMKTTSAAAFFLRFRSPMAMPAATRFGFFFHLLTRRFGLCGSGLHLRWENLRFFSFEIICSRSSWASSLHSLGHMLSLYLVADHFVSSWMLVSLNLTFVGLKPFTTCKACTRICFEYEVIVKSPSIEHTMVRQDLIVEPGAALATLNFVQSVFSGDARGFLVPHARADFA